MWGYSYTKYLSILIKRDDCGCYVDWSSIDTYIKPNYVCVWNNVVVSDSAKQWDKERLLSKWC